MNVDVVVANDIHHGSYSVVLQLPGLHGRESLDFRGMPFSAAVPFGGCPDAWRPKQLFIWIPLQSWAAQ